MNNTKFIKHGKTDLKIRQIQTSFRNPYCIINRCNKSTGTLEINRKHLISYCDLA